MAPWPQAGQSWPLAAGNQYQMTRQQSEGVTTGMGFRMGTTTHGKQKGVKYIIKVL